MNISPLSLQLIATRTNLIATAKQVPEGWVGCVVSGNDVLLETENVFESEEHAITAVTTTLAEVRNQMHAERQESEQSSDFRMYVQGDRVMATRQGQKITGTVCGQASTVSPQWIVGLDHRIPDYPFSHVLIPGESLKPLSENPFCGND